MTSKETVIIFGDPSDPIIKECAARIVAAGRRVEIRNELPEVQNIPLDDSDPLKQIEDVLSPIIHGPIMWAGTRK